MEKQYLFQKWYRKGCVITSEKLDTNYCQVQGWKKIVHVFEGHETWCIKTIKWPEMLYKKERIESLYFPEEHKVACFANN